VRKLPRRRIATLIRIRQEVDKRLDPLLPWRAGPLTLKQILTAEFAAVGARTDDELRRILAARSASRFPLSHLRTRDLRGVPAREAMERSIADAARGAWTLFGTPLAVDMRDQQWTRHPSTLIKAGDGHWTRVDYMTGIGGGDVKQIWELNRHHQLLRLAQGYFLDRSSPHAETVLRLLDAWIDQNPPGSGINWTSSLEVAFRAIAWCWIWALTCESPAWTADRVRRFLTTMWHHARHIERFDSIHHSPNTHLTGEALGLLYIGLLFPELRRASAWAERGRTILESELDVQVLDDGVHFERAVGYHRYTAEFYLHYLLLADASGVVVPAASRARVRAQVDATRVFRRPDGTWPVIGDEDSGDTLLLAPNDPQDQGPVLALGAGVFGEPSWLPLTTDVHRACAWWLLTDAQWRAVAEVTTAKRPTTVPNGALTASGYFVGRDDEDDDAWWCLVDAGPHGGERTGHAHTDLGHTEIAHGATHIVVDPGSATYTMDPAGRDHARSEAAHACLVVDGSPLAVPTGPFSWGRTSPVPERRWGDDGAIWWCELRYAREHAAGRLSHRRQVVLVRTVGVIVCDWVEGDAPRIALHWPLGGAPSDVSIAEDVATGDGFLVSWSAAAAGAGEAQPALRASLRPTFRAPGYGRIESAPLLRLEYEGPSPVSPTSAVSIVTCFSASGAPMIIDAHDGASIRVSVPGDPTTDRPVVVMKPGIAPALQRRAATTTSSGVIR
jgi:hypothetical protein